MNKCLLRLLLSLLVLTSCSTNGREVYDSLSDVANERIAFLHDSEVENAVTSAMPNATIIKHDDMLDLMFELSVGRCDAVVLDGVHTMNTINQNPDFGVLGILEEGMYVIVPVQKLLKEDGAGVNVATRWIDRIERNFIDSDGWRLIAKGFANTVVIFFFGAVLALILGIFLAYLQLSHKWQWFSKPFCWFIFTIHDVPSVVLMMFFFYVVFASIPLNGIVIAIIALAVYSSGALAKIFKVHIQQVGKGQYEAARLLGMTKYQSYRYVIFPQAFKNMLPLVVSELKVLLRATSYAGYIAQKDLIKMVEALRTQTYDAFIPLLTATLLYLLLSWLIAKAVDLIYEKCLVHD